MSDLPRGWALVSLGVVADLVAGSTPKGVLTAPMGTVPFYKVGDMNTGVGRFMGAARVNVPAATAKQLGLRICPRGTTIFPKVGGALHTNKKRILSASAAFDTNTMGARPLPVIDPDFLYYWLDRLNLSDFAYGSPVPQLSRSRLSDEPLLLPPQPEQERIVAAIEEEFSRIDAGVAELDSARARLDSLLRAVEGAATLGLLVPQDHDDEPASELLKRARVLREKAMHEAGRASLSALAPDTSNLPKLPSAWAWASLDEVADVAGGVTKDQKKQGAPGNVEVPYLRVANVQRGRLDLTHVTTIRVPPQQAEALRLLPGDILFNEGGDRDKLGRGWIWEGQIDNCVHQNHVFRARLYSDELNPRFLSTHGNAFGRSWFERMGKQTTNLASLNRTTLRSFPVPIPPAAEQQRIMDVLAAWTAAIRAAAEKVEAQTRRSHLLRSTVLTAAFSGSLVPQDHSNEPAARLLERLAAERAPSNGHQTARSHRPRTRVTA